MRFCCNGHRIRLPAIACRWIFDPLDSCLFFCGRRRDCTRGRFQTQFFGIGNWDFLGSGWCGGRACLCLGKPGLSEPRLGKSGLRQADWRNRNLWCAGLRSTCSTRGGAVKFRLSGGFRGPAQSRRHRLGERLARLPGILFGRIGFCHGPRRILGARNRGVRHVLEQRGVGWIWRWHWFRIKFESGGTE